MGILKSIAGWTRSPAIFRDQGDAARDVGEWSKAATFYSQYLARVPEDAAIWVQFGHAEKESGKLEAAEQAYLRALSIEPGNPDTQVMLGHVQKLMGNHDEAVARYRKALEFDPAFQPALEELASYGLTGNVASTRSGPPATSPDLPKGDPPAAPAEPTPSLPPSAPAEPTLSLPSSAPLAPSRSPPGGPANPSRSRPPSAPLDLSEIDRRVGLLAQQYASVKALANELEKLRSRVGELEHRIAGQDEVIAKLAASSGSSGSETENGTSRGKARPLP